MAPTRRSLILAAGGAGLALVAGLGSYRVTRLPEQASAPWRLGAAPEDVRLDALRHAILAPNPHNRQPWLMRLDGSDSVVVTCDLERRLPQTDPFDRQITIGFGCFLELAHIAAAERGYRIEMQPFPEGEPQPRLDARPVASLRFVRDGSIRPDPLYGVLLARRSTKEVFAAKPVESDSLRHLVDGPSEGARLAATNDPVLVEHLRALILEAGEIELTTRRALMESVDLMRIGHREIDALPDGIDLDGPLIEGLSLVGLIDRTQLADPMSRASQAGAKRFRASYGSGASYFWITTPGNARADQLAAGRAYVRANLLATRLGLAVHPVSQALQEYAEMREPLERAHRLTGAAGNERVQMLARIGYCEEPVRPSPRWPLETRLIAPSGGAVAKPG